jgi:hypothetical protein
MAPPGGVIVALRRPGELFFRVWAPGSLNFVLARALQLQCSGKTPDHSGRRIRNPSRVKEREIMKLPNTLVAVAIASLFAGGAIAGEGKDKSGSMGPGFDTLDTNRDGRISQTEASADASLVFTSADQNGDGYLDKDEWKSHDKMKSSPQPQSQSMPDSTPSDPTSTSSDIPSTTPEPDTETPRQ